MELRSFLLSSKWPAVVKAAEGQNIVNLNEPDQTPSVEQCKGKLKESLQAYLSKKASIEKSMSLYLSNPETEAIIFKQVKVSLRTNSD